MKGFANLPVTAPRRKMQMIAGAGVLLVVVMAMAITFGNYRIPISQVLRVILQQLGAGVISAQEYSVIVWEIRLPRILMAACCGMGLSLSGAVFQGVFRNPLVEPYVLGVSSGAACGAALSILLAGGSFVWGGVFSAGALAFAFAVAAMALAYCMATVRGQTPLVNLILSGMIVSSVFTALLNLLKVFATDGALREITFWLMGGFYTADWNKLLWLVPCVTICFLVFWRLGWQLNVLATGDQEAQALGVSVGRLKLVSLGLATFLTAACVSQTGIISWVGLMIPHIARMLLGPDHRYLIPFSALCGGCFLVVCDTLARTLMMGELPVSIITSMLGAPYLIYLLRTNRQVYFT